MRKTHLFIFTTAVFTLINSSVTLARRTPNIPMPLPSVPASDCSYAAGSLAPYNDAKAKVDYYEAQRRSATSLKNTVTYSFKININDLYCYITSATLDKMSFLHFVLGQEQPSGANPRPPLQLYIAGVNGDGNHIYIEDNSSNFFILQCNPSAEHVLPAQGATPLYTTGTYKSIIKAFGTPLVAGGAEMVAAYYLDALMDHTASSFTYAYDNFLGYINDAKNKGCDTIQFFLAEDCGRLTLVILGTKANVPCYINDPNIGVSVLDHSDPCPTCYQVNIGDPGLETPTSN